MRVIFTDAVATEVYAIDDCDCTIDSSNWWLGLQVCDPDSCMNICDPDTFAAACGEVEVTCDQVTVYENCDYSGDELVVTDD